MENKQQDDSVVRSQEFIEEVSDVAARTKMVWQRKSVDLTRAFLDERLVMESIPEGLKQSVRTVGNMIRLIVSRQKYSSFLLETYDRASEEYSMAEKLFNSWRPRIAAANEPPAVLSSLEMATANLRGLCQQLTITEGILLNIGIFHILKILSRERCKVF